MPARFLSDVDLARLTGWPDQVTGEELAAFFTLTRDDVAWVVDGRRGAGNRLGLAVQRCTLPWLGWAPDDLTGCPAAAAARLADSLGIAAGEAAGLLAGYGGWQGDTRRTHLREVLERLGWRTCGSGEWKQLDALLAARALEHDAPTVLFAQSVDWLRGERIVRPAVDSLVRAVGAAREAATVETVQRLAPLLDDGQLVAGLDELLAVDAEATPEGHTSISCTVTHTQVITILYIVLPSCARGTRGSRLRSWHRQYANWDRPRARRRRVSDPVRTRLRPSRRPRARRRSRWRWRIR